MASGLYVIAEDEAGDTTFQPPIRSMEISLSSYHKEKRKAELPPIAL
jgi:hypothetical protein